MRNYRRSHLQLGTKEQPAELSKAVIDMLELVKNNLAFDLKACPATVLFLSADKSVKNILAASKIILIHGHPRAEGAAL